MRSALLIGSVDRDKGFEARPAERVKALTAIAQLRERLEKSAADAPLVFADMVEILRGTVPALALNGLGQSVKEFDFEAALSKLEEISEQYCSSQS
jgi:hypothetical protein